MTHQSDAEDDAARLAAMLAPTLALLNEVAHDSHLTRAAESLGIPQPTISRTLTRLTTQFGTPMTVREGRRIHLTRTASALATASQEALRVLEAGCRAAIEDVSPERGQIMLGFQHTMGSQLVPHLISGFHDEHPRVRFGLVQGARDDLLARTASGEIDLALISPPPDRGGRFGSATLRTQPLVVVLPERHRLARRRRLRLVDLADEDFIATRPGYGLRRIFAALAEQAGFTPRVAFEGEEVDTLRGLVAARLGVALLPADDRGPAPGTVEIALSPPATRTLGLAWTVPTALPPVARAFRDFAIEHHAPRAE